MTQPSSLSAVLADIAASGAHLPAPHPAAPSQENAIEYFKRVIRKKYAPAIPEWEFAVLENSHAALVAQSETLHSALKEANRQRDALVARVAELEAVVSRGMSVHMPNALWTRAEKARSQQAWYDEARAVLAKGQA